MLKLKSVLSVIVLLSFMSCQQSFQINETNAIPHLMSARWIFEGKENPLDIEIDPNKGFMYTTFSSEEISYGGVKSVKVDGEYVPSRKKKDDYRDKGYSSRISFKSINPKENAVYIDQYTRYKDRYPGSYFKIIFTSKDSIEVYGRGEYDDNYEYMGKAYRNDFADVGEERKKVKTSFSYQRPKDPSTNFLDGSKTKNEVLEYLVKNGYTEINENAGHYVGSNKGMIYCKNPNGQGVLVYYKMQ